ncbi:MAG: lysylphosphatidylglycerol synthase domain-containing protein, partial [Actinomycetota bacterium]
MVALRRAGAWIAGLAVTVVAAVLIVRFVDHESLGAAWRRMARDPAGMVLATGAYALAFVLRGVIWCRVLPSLRLGQSVAAIHVTLLGNHVLPVRLGEPLRVVSVVARAGIPLGAAVASTVSMRAADILGVAVLGLLLGPGLVLR